MRLFLSALLFPILVFGQDASQSEQVKDSTISITRKNFVHLQLGGDTPVIGVRLGRRLFESKNEKLSIESGLGFGLFPSFLRDREIVNYSANTILVNKHNSLVHSFVGYSGLLLSGNFYKNKRYNYWHAPMLGFRFGNSNTFAVNIYWQGYIYKTTKNLLVNGDTFRKVDRTNFANLAGLSLHVPFK